MNIIPIGWGQGGSNMVDDLVGKVKKAEKERGIQIFPRVNGVPAVFAVNIGAGDLSALTSNIPNDYEHRILLGTRDEFRGRGAGKVNIDGAAQAERGVKSVVEAVMSNSGDAEDVDAIFLFAATAGGTGSGGISVIGDALKAKLPKMPIYAVLILPFAHDYSDAASMVNTATCLNEVLNHSRIDATILVDNEHYVRINEQARDNLKLINLMFANSILDLLCAGEERDRQYIGQVVDARDIRSTMRGITAIGASYVEVPKEPLKVAGFRVGNRHFLAKDEQTKRGLRAINQALKNTSIECGFEQDGDTYYDAGRLLTLFIGPNEEATQGIVDMIDTTVGERIPAGKEVERIKGTYPRKLKKAIGAVVIISDIGKGAASDLIEFFYKKGQTMYENVAIEREERKVHHEKVAESAKDLPRLRKDDREGS